MTYSKSYKKSSIFYFCLLALIAGCDTQTTSTVTNNDSGKDAIQDGSNSDVSLLPARATGSSHGSAVALSEDDSRIIAVNRNSDSVSVFSVTYNATNPPTVTKMVELPVGGEPWQVVIHPDGDTAFVVCRKDQKVVKISGLKSTPTNAGEVKVGSEPTSIALTPSGSTAWVTNWNDGTVQGVQTTTMTAPIEMLIDLNDPLVQANYLGSLAPRPGLAHPRSIAITNFNETPDDEQIMFVTEYFSQQKEPLAVDGSNADINRVGLVYKISVGSKKVNLIELPPLTDLGFKDHNNNPAGCFPSQLQSINIQGAFGYVLSVCASPKGPTNAFTGPAFATCTGTDSSTCPGGSAVASCVNSRCSTNCTLDTQCGANGGKCTNNKCETNWANIKTTSTPAITVLDLRATSNFIAGKASLNWAMHQAYQANSVADDATRRLPHIANDIGFIPGTVTAFITANGTDAVFRINFDPNYGNPESPIQTVGDPATQKNPYIPLDPAGVDPSKIGRLPLGIAITKRPQPDLNSPRYGFVINEATQNISVIDLKANEVAGLTLGSPTAVNASPLPTDKAKLDVIEGKRLFNTGLGRWSLNGQGWGSCQNCHIDGLADGVTWFFAKGARQSLSLEGTFASKDPTDQRVILWSAHNDQVSDVEGVLRNTNGGVGSIVSSNDLKNSSRIDIDTLGHGGLNGSSMDILDPNPNNPAKLNPPSLLPDWLHIDEYVKKIRSPRKPSLLDSTKVNAGKVLFTDANCQGCHGGPKWSISKLFYQPDYNKITNNTLKITSWASAAANAGLPQNVWPTLTASYQTMRYPSDLNISPVPNPSSFDSMTCILRNVETYGLGEQGVNVVELRNNMSTASQGSSLKNSNDTNGYNPPSLLGLAAGAPYFHAGNARTLEAALSDTFVKHHASLSPGFLGANDTDRAQKITNLVQFLLSIDEDTTVIDIPALGPKGGVLCSLPPPPIP